MKGGSPHRSAKRFSLKADYAGANSPYLASLATAGLLLRRSRFQFCFLIRSRCAACLALLPQADMLHQRRACPRV